MTNNKLYSNSIISTSVNQVSSLNPNASSFVNNKTDCGSLQSSSISESSHKSNISCPCNECEGISDLYSDCNDSLQLVAYSPTQSQTKTTSGSKHLESSLSNDMSNIRGNKICKNDFYNIDIDIIYIMRMVVKAKLSSLKLS